MLWIITLKLHNHKKWNKQIENAFDKELRKLQRMGYYAKAGESLLRIGTAG